MNQVLIIDLALVCKFLLQYTLVDKVGSCKIIQEDATCRNLFYEALQYHLLADRRSEMMPNNARLKPRSCLGKQI